MISTLLRKPGKLIAALLALLVMGGAFLVLLRDQMPKGTPREVSGYTEWSEDVVRAAAKLPVQSGGRIKPLMTHASFTMLGMYGGRAMKISDGEGKTIKLKPTEWMLDVLFRPEFAIKEPTFRVDNSDVLKAIGVEAVAKRDRYSYEEVQKGRAKLLELAQTYEKIDANERDPQQRQTIALADSMRSYEELLGYFYFARNGVVLHGTAEQGGEDARNSVSTVLASWQMMRPMIEKGTDVEKDRVNDLGGQVETAASLASHGLAILPPYSPKSESWMNAGQVMQAALDGSFEDATQPIQDVALLENLARAAASDVQALRKSLASLEENLGQRVVNHSAVQHQIDLEVSYMSNDWFLKALVCFIIASLLALGMWGMGKGFLGTCLASATALATLAGVGFCTVAIVQRCMIMQRPPIGNLYDTVIFIATTITLLCLVVELLTRKRFALGMAPMLGMLLVILSRRFEVGDATDHMNPLVAVLQSNFWLTIHVITISFGYSAGLLSAFLGTLYVLMRGLGLDDGDANLRRTLTRAVYGTLCLTLFLSLVGTVLGGIWANYSWGRFWGWDPKENGALLIVLWTLAIVHARAGGIIREWGLHLAAVFTAVVVTFSWWHVNFLNVGLHNYGFTAGKGTIWFFYSVVLAILAVGLLSWAFDASRKETLSMRNGQGNGEA